LLVRPAPERREGLEAGDGQHPRRHRRAPFEPTSLTPHVEKHLADHVLRPGLIPNETYYEPKHTHVVPRIQHLHGEPIAVRDSAAEDVVGCRLHRFRAVGLVRLVASGYRWVHGSATEMVAGGPPSVVAPPRMIPAFGAKIMAEARSRGTRAPLNFAINLTIYGRGRGPAGTPCAGARRQASSISAVRQGLTQVPIRSGVLSLRRTATTESAVIRPVRGFSEGTFSIARVKRAESLSTSTVWQLRSTEGSAQISIIVRSGPMPASASAAATLTLAGKPPAPPPAAPERTSLGPGSPSGERPLGSGKSGARQLRGGLPGCIGTGCIGPPAAAVTASSPSGAPVGTMICPPRAFASSIRSGRGNRAPTESTITCFPASSIGRQMRSSTQAGVHSTARSAWAGNAS